MNATQPQPPAEIAAPTVSIFYRAFGKEGLSREGQVGAASYSERDRNAARDALRAELEDEWESPVMIIFPDWRARRRR